MRRYEKFCLRIDLQDPWIWTFNDESQRRTRKARVKGDMHKLPTPRNKRTPVDIMRDVCEAHYHRHSQRAASLRDLTGFKMSEILNSFLVTMMGRGAVHVGPLQSDPAPLVDERPPKNMFPRKSKVTERSPRDDVNLLFCFLDPFGYAPHSMFQQLEEDYDDYIPLRSPLHVLLTRTGHYTAHQIAW